MTTAKKHMYTYSQLMCKPVTRLELIKMVLQSTGRIASITFTKRTTGQHRTITFRPDIKSNGTGKLKYKLKENLLIQIYDMLAQHHKSIDILGNNLALKSQGQTYILKNECQTPDDSCIKYLKEHATCKETLCCDLRSLQAV